MGKNIENSIFQELLKAYVSYLAEILYNQENGNIYVSSYWNIFVSRSHEFTFSNFFHSVTPGPNVRYFMFRLLGLRELLSKWFQSADQDRGHANI